MICEHGRRKDTCKECGGNQIWEHGRVRSTCKECGGGSICEHGRVRSTCKECGGGSICEHDKIRSRCKICDPSGAVAYLLRTRIRNALKENRRRSSLTELLGCSIQECRRYLEELFEDGMSWDNNGNGPDMWNIDHRRPCASFNLENDEEKMMCFHHTNLQPMWRDENLSKSASFDEESFDWEWDGSQWIEID